MNEIKTSDGTEIDKVSTILVNGKVYFPAIPNAKVCGYSEPQQAIADHCQQDRVIKRSITTSKGVQQIEFIDEDNLYRLILNSDLPLIKQAELWWQATIIIIAKNILYDKHGECILSK